MDDYYLIGLVHGIAIGALCMAIGLLIFLPNYPLMNIEGFGTHICEAQHMQYQEYSYLPNEFYVPVIHCINRTQIIDHVVIGVST